MIVKAHAPWAGCKRLLAPRIVELLGPHHAYWEPFAGGAAVFYAKVPCRIEVLNDLHGDLTNLVRIIADRKLGPMLYRRLRRTMFCQEIHADACARLEAERDPLERAYLYFIKLWMSWGGVAGTKRGGHKTSIRYTNSGGHQATRFHSAVASIPAWRRRLQHATILNTDAFKLIPNIEDAPATVIYVDAPYPDNSVNYEHEFPSLEAEREARARGDDSVKGHIALADLLGRFKRTRIVISYYSCPMLDELYAGWNRHEIEVTKTIAQIAKRQSHRQRATEVLLVNRQGDQFGSLFASTRVDDVDNS
jgi:DNA adenine methylase